MKHKTLAVLFTLLLILTFAPLIGASASGDIRYVVTSNHKSLNMRADMSTDSFVITTIPYGAEVHLIGICDHTSWASVYYGDNNGYVMVRYLSPRKPSSSETDSTSSVVDDELFTDADCYVIVNALYPYGLCQFALASLHGRRRSCHLLSGRHAARPFRNKRMGASVLRLILLIL